MLMMPHVPYSEHADWRTQWLRYDRRARLNGIRTVWRRALLDTGSYPELETDVFIQDRMCRRIEAIQAIGSATGWREGPAAFEPVESTYPSWRRMLVRDEPLLLSSLRPFDAGNCLLRSLGAPEDVGANGWVAAPFYGRSLVIPSLTLLLALAIPSLWVWHRLKHPLSMDLVSRRSPDDTEILEITREASLPHTLRIAPNNLCTLAFWIEQCRLSCLHRALEGFGDPGWTLTLPDLQEVVKLTFDGYERGDLLVVQRIRVSHAARFLPRTWRQVRYLGRNGTARLSVGKEQFEEWSRQ